MAPGAVKQLIEIAGTLAANQEVSISSELTKKVVSVPVKEGHIVGKGALLFQLDDADLQAQMERLRQQEKLAALNEARLKDLIAHDAASQQDYDQAATNLAVLKAEIRQLETTIDKTRIRLLSPERSVSFAPIPAPWFRPTHRSQRSWMMHR